MESLKMDKIDFKKELKQFYNASALQVVAVDIPKMNFLMIDGQGNPNSSKEFQHAVEALYGLSYALKFMIKKGKPAIDYGVLPLEGLWWADDMRTFSADKKDEWKWTIMIMQPEYVTTALIAEAFKQVEKKGLPALPKVRFESFAEGRAAQILHVGPFSQEGPTIARVHNFIKENTWSLAGKHHEIYLSDMRKTAPEKLRTIIRQPYQSA
jgi:hypothetical protein